ncbi:MAG: amidohydrolase, partial [Bdellovibrionales bacterium]|nr:amidohydrolase [Bdellovibrionales bacterium]
FRRVDPNAFDPKVRIQECDDHGVNMQVLSTIPVMFSYWSKGADGHYIAQHLNDHIAQVVRDNPKRFFGLGTLPMQDVDLSLKEIERSTQTLGLKGFQIGSHINEWNLSDKRFFPIYEELERTGAALFIHPWDMMGQERMQKYWLPWLVGMPAETSLAICSMIFGGVFEKFPKLRVAFAHGGGSFPFTLGRIEHGFQCRPDLVAIDNKVNPRDYIGRFYVDSLVHDSKSLAYLIELFGTKQICLGSDYPFPLGEERPGTLIESMQLTENEMKNLLSLSALNWLGVKESELVV